MLTEFRRSYYKFQNNRTFDLFSSNEQSVAESFQNVLECVAFYMTEFWKDSVRWRVQTVRGRFQMLLPGNPEAQSRSDVIHKSLAKLIAHWNHS
jgi:hypothetical protein